MGAKDKLLAMIVPGILLTSATSALPQNWTRTSAPQTNWMSVACSADGGQLAAAAYGFSWFGGGWGGPIYTSTNSGASWTSVLPTNLSAYPYLNLNWVSLAASADFTKLFVAGWPQGDDFQAQPIGLSTNAGETWTNTGTFTGDWWSVAASADGSKVAATKRVVDAYGLFLSTNSAASWRFTGVTNVLLVAWSADGTTLLAAGSRLAVSTNTGATWNLAPFTNVYWSAVACSADGTRLAAATTSGWIYSSANSGRLWNVTSAPNLPWQALALSADGTRLVAGVPNGPIYTSTDSGLNWTSNNAPQLDWKSVASSADGHTRAAAVDGGGIYISRTTPTPVLSITPSASGFLISWIVPSMPFVLQENADLTTTNWTDVITTPNLNFTNLHHVVSVPLSSTNRFYQLKSL